MLFPRNLAGLPGDQVKHQVTAIPMVSSPSGYRDTDPTEEQIPSRIRIRVQTTHENLVICGEKTDEKGILDPGPIQILERC